MAAGRCNPVLNPSSSLQRLLDAPIRRGTVQWIGLRPARHAEMCVVTEARLDPAEGLIGDHYAGRPGGARQVSLISREQLAAIASYLGRPEVAPELLRRNLVVSGINLVALKGRRFLAGNRGARGDRRVPSLLADGAAPGCGRLQCRPRHGRHPGPGTQRRDRAPRRPDRPADATRRTTRRLSRRRRRCGMRSVSPCWVCRARRLRGARSRSTRPCRRSRPSGSSAPPPSRTDADLAARPLRLGRRLSIAGFRGVWVERAGHGTLWQDGYWRPGPDGSVWVPGHWM